MQEYRGIRITHSQLLVINKTPDYYSTIVIAEGSKCEHCLGSRVKC